MPLFGRTEPLAAAARALEVVAVGRGGTLRENGIGGRADNRGRMVWAVIGLALGCAAACSSASSGGPVGPSGVDGAAPETDAGDAGAPDSSPGPAVPGACGLAVYPAEYASCQVALDQACCDVERACAADHDCRAVVACVTACPQALCLGVCATEGPAGQAAPFINFEMCGKSMPAPSIDSGVCGWPY